MTVGTFTGELAREGGRWWMAVEIAGMGRRVGATTAALRDTWRVCTEYPGDHGWSNDETDPYVPRLLRPGGVLEEKIDLRAGRTALGSFDFEVLDGSHTPANGTATGWGSDIFTDLFVGIQGPAHSSHSTLSGKWELDANIANATVPTIELVARTDIAVGDALWLGSEVMICTAAPGSGSNDSIDVARGQYGTTAVAHSLKDEGGEGVLYDRPRHWLGRRVRVYIGLWDSRAGSTSNMLDESELRLVWQGTLDAWDGGLNSFKLAVKPAMGRLDRKIGREQFVGTVSFPNSDLSYVRSQLERIMRSNEQLSLPVVVPDGDGMVTEPGYPDDVSGFRDFYGRLDNQIVRCKYIRITFQEPHMGNMAAISFGLLGTLPEPRRGLNADLIFREVLIVAPDPGDTTPALYFVDSSGNPSAHPVDVMLTLATSTGTATEAVPVGSNGDWDTLPAHWGCGVPIAEFNLDSFRRVRGRTPGLALPRLILGWDGEPIPLRSWLEDNVLAPLGWFLYLDEDGLISLGDLADVYPGQSLPTIADADWLDTLGAPRPSMSGALDLTTTWQTWRYDYDWQTDEPRKTVRYRHAQALERGGDTSAEITFELRGADDRAGALVFSRANQLARLFVSPLPLYKLAVGMHRLDLSIGEGVYLTCSVLGDPFTGAVGITARNAFIIERSLDFGAGRIGLVMILLGEPNTALVAPAGTVASYVAGPPPVITLNANDYTAADAGGQVPARDALGFAVDDVVMLIDGDGVPLSDNEVKVAAVESGGNNKLELDTAFTLGGGGVTPVAGNVVVYQHWASGGTPAKTWTANMQKHAAQADSTDSELPDGSEAYVYGG